MRVMILGAGGMLGRDLVSSAPPDCEIVALTREQLDITDQQRVKETIVHTAPNTIINAAGYTAVDKAEADRAGAFRVNAEAVGLIGQAAAAVGATVVHFSTDYVFDGDTTRPYVEEDIPKPINAYGASKLAGEIALAECGIDHVIVRTSWLFGRNGRSFPRTMWERAMAGRSTRVVNDQYGRPTYTVDLAATTWELLRSNERGVFHVANAGHTTWFDVGAFVFRFAGVEKLVSACSTADYPTAARRPKFSVLDTTRADTLLGKSLSSWQTALQRFLTVLRSERLGERKP
ncbi:MAG TPA: dTDP-4-dehydrorhamnose reductase [Gemmatimonadales bacterium]|nr:dTDP-4-dehydrorhamnose reductase [Gemmatimonadales bacterium]